MRERLKTLYSRHSILEAKIQGEEGRPRPDSMQVRALKKIKLKLREQIDLFETRLHKVGEA